MIPDNIINTVASYNPEMSDLDLSASLLEKVMGYQPGKTPSLYLEKIEDVLEKASKKVQIEVGFMIMTPHQFQCHTGGFNLNQTKFQTGSIIARQLKNSQTIALFAGTAGPVFDTWSKKLFEEGDFPSGYVVDLAGSEIVESAIDWLEKKLQEKIGNSGLAMTNRFSPGYCGWNVKEQFKLFSFLPEQFCGIYLTDAALMVPIKSVSGVIGIGENVEKKGYPCDHCQVKNCYRRVKFMPDQP